MGSTHRSNEFMRIGSGKVIANFNTLTTTQKQDLLDFLRSLLGAPTPGGLQSVPCPIRHRPAFHPLDLASRMLSATVN